MFMLSHFGGKEALIIRADTIWKSYDRVSVHSKSNSICRNWHAWSKSPQPQDQTQCLCLRLFHPGLQLHFVLQVYLDLYFGAGPETSKIPRIYTEITKLTRQACTKRQVSTITWAEKCEECILPTFNFCLDWADMSNL